MKKIKENKLFLMSITLLVVVILFPYIFLGKEFIVGYDIKNLYVPFYNSILRSIESLEIPFWSHDFFLGVNVWSSKAFLYLGDIFAYLIILFKNIDFADYMLIVQIIKYFLTFLFFSLLLKEFNIPKKIRIIGALLYTFCSWSFIFMGTPAFTTFFCFTPLLFIGIERYINKNNGWLVVLSSFMLVTTCFYMFWSISFFLILYWPIRYFLKYKFDIYNLKRFIISTLKLIGYYVAGVLIAAPLVIPTGLFMIESPRVQASEKPTLLWNTINIYYDMFIKFISAPVYVNANIDNFFGNNYYRLDQIALFTSSLTCLLLPQIFIILKGQKRVVITIFYTILLFIIISPIGGSIMHGFSESSFRWLFLALLCIILTDCYVLLNLDKINKKVLTCTIVLYFLAVIFILFNVQDVFKYKLQLLMICISLVLLVIYYLLIIKNNMRLINILIVFELMLVGTITYAVLPDYSNSYNYDQIGISKDYFDNLDSNEFYRVYFTDDIVDMDYVKDFNYNSNLYYNFKGFYSYDSTAQTSIKPLLNWEKEFFWWFKVNNSMLLNNLSMKYVVTEYEDNLPLYLDYEFIEQIQNSKYKLYLNKDYKPFGFTANVISFEEFITLQNKGLPYESYEYGIVVDDYYIDLYDLKNIVNENKHLTNVVYDNNHISGDINLDSKQLLFLSIPIDRGWNIFDNGEPIEILNVEGGLMGIVLDKGNHHISMSFVPKGFKIGVAISLGTIIVLFFTYIWKRKR